MPDVGTAHHEAGHAVAVYLHGGHLTYVSALPDAPHWGGICSWKLADDACDCDLSPLHEAIVALAGPIAQASLTAWQAQRALERRSARTLESADNACAEASPIADNQLARLRYRHDNRGGMPTDEQRAQTLIAQVAFAPDEAHAITYWLKVRTWKLVESRRFEALLTHLAGVRLDRGPIDGPTATTELQRAELQYERAHELAEETGETCWEAA
jgi:hypothetical protein